MMDDNTRENGRAVEKALGKMNAAFENWKRSRGEEKSAAIEYLAAKRLFMLTIERALTDAGMEITLVEDQSDVQAIAEMLREI